MPKTAQKCREIVIFSLKSAGYVWYFCDVKARESHVLRRFAP